MKTMFSLALLSLLLFMSPAQAQDNWKEYTYDHDHMAFSLPADPVIKSTLIETAAGKVTSHQYSLNNKSYTILVNTAIYPSAATLSLTGARDGMLKNIKAKEITETPITLNGNAGIEFKFKGQGLHGSARLYLAGSSLYQLVYLCEDGSSGLSGIQQFFDSFQITL